MGAGSSVVERRNKFSGDCRRERMKAMAERSGLTKNEIISALSKSPHGKLEEYLPIGSRAATESPDFLGRLDALKTPTEKRAELEKELEKLTASVGQ
jgi:hypothetical protein